MILQKTNNWVFDPIKPHLSLEAKNDETEAIIIGIYLEVTRLIGKDNNASKSGSLMGNKKDLIWELSICKS